MSTVIVIVLLIFQDNTVNDVVETENALIDHTLTTSETPLTQKHLCNTYDRVDSLFTLFSIRMPSEDLSCTTLKGLLKNLSSQVKRKM